MNLLKNMFGYVCEEVSALIVWKQSRLEDLHRAGVNGQVCGQGH